MLNDHEGRVWYLAGPMSGKPQFNYPMFFEVADALRKFGYTLISPAEQDGPEELKLILASEDGDLSKLPQVGTWGDFLSHDVKLIADEVTGMIFLPGWQTSRGARLEAFVALSCGHPLMEANKFDDQWLLANVSANYIKRELFNNV